MMMILTLDDISRLIARVTFPAGWQVRLMEKGDGFLIQITFWARDNGSDKIAEQRCRKWYISKHSTDTEVVRTLYKAGQAALSHEFDETFKFDGVAIYNPHLGVHNLVAAIQFDGVNDASFVGIEEDRRA